MAPRQRLCGEKVGHEAHPAGLLDKPHPLQHPGGPRLQGHPAVTGSWRAILANGPLRVRASSKKTLETPTIALHNVVEEIVVQRGRSQAIVHVIATNAYVKTPAGWKMVLHHASAAPDGQATDVESPSGPLH